VLSSSNACNSDNGERSEGINDDITNRQSVGISCPTATVDATSERRVRETSGNTPTLPPRRIQDTVSSLTRPGRRSVETSPLRYREYGGDPLAVRPDTTAQRCSVVGIRVCVLVVVGPVWFLASGLRSR
jgi:hypothetical protein